MAQRPLSELTDNSMKNLQAILDTDTVVGDPIHAPGGIVILPVSKVSFGFASGGCDLPTTKEGLFGGGAGGGVTVSPVAFLVVKDGEVTMLQVQPFNSTADRVVGMVPEVIDKINGFLKKKSADQKADGEPAAGPAPVEPSAGE